MVDGSVESGPVGPIYVVEYGKVIKPGAYPIGYGIVLDGPTLLTQGLEI